MAKASDQIEAKNAEFYTDVGKFITTWAEIDNNLFNICHDVLGCSWQHAGIVYSRFKLLAAKLAFVDTLIVSVIPKPAKKNGGHIHKDEKLWRRIIAGISDRFGVRTRVAHSEAH